MKWFMLIYAGSLLMTGSSSGADFKSILSKAEKGDKSAQYRLAEMYAEAQGVDQDYLKASQWARKAADQGDARAQYRLASIMYLGIDGKEFRVDKRKIKTKQELHTSLMPAGLAYTMNLEELRDLLAFLLQQR